MKIGIAVGVMIAVVAFVVCVVPLKEVAYTVTIDYQDIETYYETEPYEVNTTEPLDYEVIRIYHEVVKVLYRDDFEFPGLERECDYGDPAPKFYVLIENIDGVSGTFNIHFWLRTFTPNIIVIDGQEIDWSMPREMDIFWNHYEGKDTIYLEQGERGQVEYLAYQVGLGEGNAVQYLAAQAYRINLYDGGELELKFEVTGTKTVTKTEYRQVEKQRTVTKQRPETRYKKVTLLDYLLHY